MRNTKFEIKSCGHLQSYTVSHAAVTGAMLIGCGRTYLNELLTAMYPPNLNKKTDAKCHSDVSNWWTVAQMPV